LSFGLKLIPKYPSLPQKGCRHAYRYLEIRGQRGPGPETGTDKVLGQLSNPAPYGTFPDTQRRTGLGNGVTLVQHQAGCLLF